LSKYRILAHLSLPLVFLHARASDNTTIVTLLPIIKCASYISAAQISLYRFISASNVQDRQAFSEALFAIYQVANEIEKKEIRKRIAGKDGLLGVFEKEAESQETIAGAFRSSTLFPRLLLISSCS